MANQLKMAKIQSILTLHQNGWSARRIARELGIHRETVRRYIRQAEDISKPSKAPPGSDGRGGSKPTKAPPGSRSACEPFRDIIEVKLQQGLTAQRIYQDLVAEYGFGSKYHSVRRFIRKLAQNDPPPFRRMECAPGEEAQVDFGTGAPIVDADGRRKRTHVLRVVLSQSRKGYSEVVFRQTTEAFLQSLENAFRAWGGVPRTLIIDNFKAAVKHPDWYDPELNPRLAAFARHYGIVILPAKPYTPRHKGKVERGVGYVKSNALKGRTFRSLNEQNAHLQNWEANIADTRIHGTTRKQVKKLFEQVERPTLQPLPEGRFPFFHEARRSVHRDGHVEIARSYYSVPPEYVGRTVWARWDGRLVRIYNRRMEPIATHAQCSKGRFSTRREHIHDRKISNVERGTTWMLRRVRHIGDDAARWAEAMLADRGIAGVRVLVGLHSLTNRHESDAINHACRIALSHNAFRLRTIRSLLRREGKPQNEFEFLQQHPIIRDLNHYDRMVSTSLAASETR